MYIKLGDNVSFLMLSIPGPSKGTHVNAIGTTAADKPLSVLRIRRRNPDKDDVVMEIDYCGVCHSDIHQARNEWQNTIYPSIPGHEIVGRVIQLGTNVSEFKVGDKVAVGAFVDSCRNCESCKSGVEMYCKVQPVFTYNSPYGKDEGSPTCGGYSSMIVVDKNYLFHLPDNLPMHEAAPLLCAGITVFSPLKQLGVGKGWKVAVAGLGGLGHMAVKFAVAMGAHCAVLSRSDKKKDLALKMGANELIVSGDKAQMEANAGRFNVIIDTISAVHDYDEYLNLLDVGGTLVAVGAPLQKVEVTVFSLILKNLRLMGSAVGSVKDTKEMLDLCGKKNITCQVEVIKPDQINEAFDRAVKGDVFFRFVIDLTDLRKC